VVRFLILLGVLVTFPKFKSNIDKHYMSEDEMDFYRPCLEDDLYKIVNYVNSDTRDFAKDLQWVYDWHVVCILLIAVEQVFVGLKRFCVMELWESLLNREDRGK
jgi:hypothetical protein